MMGFTFATCVKKTALEYLIKLYPSKNVTEERVSKVLGLIEKEK